jgi:ABC-type spermidine/putrescine transport system permease subunit II
VTTAAETLTRPARDGIGTRAWRFVARHTLTAYAFVVVGYLMLPIVVVILFSFNHPPGRLN